MEIMREILPLIPIVRCLGVRSIIKADTLALERH